MPDKRKMRMWRYCGADNCWRKARSRSTSKRSERHGCRCGFGLAITPKKSPALLPPQFSPRQENCSLFLLSAFPLPALPRPTPPLTFTIAIRSPRRSSDKPERWCVRNPPPRCSIFSSPPHPRLPRRSSNTAKLSPILLNRTSRLSFAGDPRPRRPSASPGKMPLDAKEVRRRRSSSLVYTEPPESLEQLSDQAALPNLNAQWVNAKGAWVIHFVLIALGKILFDIIPGVSQETSWTLTNISYVAGSYLMFHYVRGVPFDFNSGAYDNLNMWEQIDNGDQYTPAKKFLLMVPIGLFLLSTHYTRYDLTYFIINTMATLAVVIPKLPAAHRLRISFFSPPPDDA